MKTLPFALQYIFYDDGNYNNIQSKNEMKMYGNQKSSGIHQATGIRNSFMNNYLTITNLDTMTNITSDKTNTFLFLSNDVTHEETLLDAANNYTPNYIIDNTIYDNTHSDRFTLPTGETLNITNSHQMMHYHVNMTALIELGKWFDYLKSNGTYDNTRIIIASDHGRDLKSIEALQYENYSLESIYERKTTLKQLDEKFIPSTIPIISTAQVDQTVVVKSVDEAGKPTEWEAIDVPTNVSDLTNDAGYATIDEVNTIVAAPKTQFTLIDQVTGENYIVCMRDGNLVTYKAE
jgi:hypothetical protein